MAADAGATAALGGTLSGPALATVGVGLAAGLGLVLLGRSTPRVRPRGPSSPRVIAPGSLLVERYQSETAVRDGLLAALAAGPVEVSGRDCRALQTLVKVAAREGLEVRDADGFLVRATRQLVAAYGSAPDRRRLPLRWTVAVVRPRTDVTDGYVLEPFGPNGSGRRLKFAPGATMVLWDGDILR